jgi:predicted PurR-regulated permease PerM
MSYTPQPYTFDRVVRLLIATFVVIGLLLLIRRLSDVLVPFFIAVFLVYLINPMVRWLQLRLHLRKRILSVIITLTFFIGLIAAFFIWGFPRILDEMIRMGNLVAVFVERIDYADVLPERVRESLKDFFEDHKVVDFFSPENFSELGKKALSQMWSVLQGSYHLLTALAGAAIVLLYVVFLLLDFDNLQQRWPALVPQKYRSLAVEVVKDLEMGMHTYFRMQGLIALIVGVLFAIGFSIIGLPMGIIMGLFLGLLNLVPYLQLVGLVPALMLALMSALDSGQSFWHEALMVLIVVSVVQLVQDLYLVPKIMGRAYGLNPAIILLSLSVWGSLLGFIGLLLALPLTTILVSYYKRFVLHSDFDDTHAHIIMPGAAKNPFSNITSHEKETE